MHKFPDRIQIWFLDDDLQKSAQFQTNESLLKSISGCFQALVSARFYFIGIRNTKAYKHYFSKENKQETMDKWFPCWPLHNHPKFSFYTSKASKWTRKCAEHFNYIKTYLDFLLLEYEYRKGKPHGLIKFLEWLDIDAPKLSIPEAHVSKIIIPWKVLKIQYRDKDIVAGYRKQFVARMDDAFKAYAGSKRDIPDFVIKHFELDKSKYLD